MQILRRSILNIKNRDKFFKLSFISDMHVVAEADDDPSYPPLGNRLLWTPMTKIRKFVAHSNTTLNPPNMVICLGDIINGDNDPGYDDSFDMYMREWNNLKPSIPKALTAGNHDYSMTIPAIVDGLTKHEYVATKLGYGERPLTGGSKFNETFVVEHPTVNVRFLNFDTNKREDGSWSPDGGFMHATQLDWIYNELITSAEDVIVMFTHRFRTLMPEPECLKIEQLVKNAMDLKPKLKISLFFGHSHIYESQERTPVIGRMRQFNIPAIVDNLTAKSTDIYIGKNGVVSFEDLRWSYP